MGKLNFTDKAIIYIFSNILQALLTLVMGIFLVRFLTQFEYGTYQQIMLISGTMGPMLALALPQSLYYFIPRADSPEEKKQIVLQTFFMLLFSGILLCFITYILRYPLSTLFHNPQLADLSVIFSLYFLFSIPGKCAESAFLSLGKIHLASILTIATPIIMTIFVLGPAFLGCSFKIIVMGPLIFFVIKFIFTIYFIMKLDGGFPKVFDFNILRSQLAYSWPIALGLILGILKMKLDRFVISSFYTPDQFAIYSRGAFELPIVAIIPFTLGNLVLSKFSSYHKEGNIKKMLELWNNTLEKVALIFIPLFIFFFIFADKFITLLFTESYQGSVLIFRIYLCLLPFRLTAYRSMLQAVGETKPILKSNIISIISCLILSFLFIEIFSFHGPAIALVISELLSIAYLLFKTKNYLAVTYSDLFHFKYLKKILLYSIIVGIIISPIHFLEINKISILILSASSFFIVILFLLKKSKLLSDSDWELVKRWVTLKIFRTRFNIGQ